MVKEFLLFFFCGILICKRGINMCGINGIISKEKNKDKLIALYNDGYNDAKDSYEKIIEFINK